MQGLASKAACRRNISNKVLPHVLSQGALHLAEFTKPTQNFRSGFVASVLDGRQITLANTYSLGKIGPRKPSSLPSFRLLSNLNKLNSKELPEFV